VRDDVHYRIALFGIPVRTTKHHLRTRAREIRELIMNELDKVLYTAKVHTTSRCDGASHSSDGRLDVMLSSPGGPGSGTNPEQMFAAGWSACFEGAMGIAARKLKIALPADLAIDAEVDLCKTGGDFFLRDRLKVSLPGLEREVAQSLVNAAHQPCPYSRATRGNVDVAINVDTFQPIEQAKEIHQ
jgi:lipoyl-dependent peroxiredoxin